MKEVKKYPVPWLTITLSLITIGMYSVFFWLSEDQGITSALYTQLGSPTAIEIYDGQYWGVVLNSFLHNRPDILIANLVGIWILTAFIERRLRVASIFFLGLFASATTSIVQLTLTDNAGIGLTGVNFFLFFFVIVKGLKDDRFKMNGRYIIMLLILLFTGWSWYKSRFDGWNMAVESMIAGVLLGSFMGLLSLIRYRAVKLSLMTLTLAGFTSLLFYSPWSSDWNVHKGVELHAAQNLKEAKKYYQKAIELNPENKNARVNLYLIRLDELSSTAFYWHSKEEYLKARFYYEEILKLDPENTWAKSQIRKLP